MNILNFGSCNIDITYSVDKIVRRGETILASDLQRFPGGKGLNQAIALARSGAKAFFAGCIGEDGIFLKDLMDDSGVYTRYLKIDAEKTGHAIIQVDKSSENSIIIYKGANNLISREYIEYVISEFDNGDYLLLQNEISNLDFIVKTAYKRNMKIVLNPSPYNGDIKQIDFNMLSWLIINGLEAEDITEINEPINAVRKLKNLYPNLEVVVTLGKDGCIYTENDEIKSQAAYRVNPVDTTGAGDTFTGYFISGIASGKSACLSAKQATVAAAIATLNRGAAVSIPYLSDVINTMKTSKIVE